MTAPEDQHPESARRADHTAPDDHTALLLPPSGSSGNHARLSEREALDAMVSSGVLPEDLVDLMLAAVPGLPFEVDNAKAIARWLDQATRALGHRSDLLRLSREVDRLLDERWQAERACERRAAELAHRARVRAAKAAGTYWRSRDARRIATQATQVEVDPDAWARFKAEAVRERTTVGEALGTLVRAAIVNGQVFGESPESPDQPAQASSGRRAQLFARIAVTKPEWALFKALALEHGMTVARAVGLLVEMTASSTGSSVTSRASGPTSSRSPTPPCSTPSSSEFGGPPTVRLHEAIGYVTPDDEHHGGGEAIRDARRQGLAHACPPAAARLPSPHHHHTHRGDPMSWFITNRISAAKSDTPQILGVRVDADAEPGPLIERDRFQKPGDRQSRSTGCSGPGGPRRP